MGDIGYFLGNSLGEITALTAAESIPLTEAFDFVCYRGRIMEEYFYNNKMCSISFSFDIQIVEKLMEEFNQSQGSKIELEMVQKLSKKSGIIAGPEK